MGNGQTFARAHPRIEAWEDGEPPASEPKVYWLINCPRRGKLFSSDLQQALAWIKANQANGATLEPIKAAWVVVG